MKVNFIRKPTPEEMLPSDEFIIMKEIIVDEVSFSKFIVLFKISTDFH